MKIKYHEDHGRSVIKAITFRLIIIFTNSIIIYSFTQKLALTAGAVFVTSIGSTIIYYFHERMWNGVHWGKKLKK